MLKLIRDYSLKKGVVELYLLDKIYETRNKRIIQKL